jgi:ABC-type uncharacterized transport system permease subunit
MLEVILFWWTFQVDCLTGISPLSVLLFSRCLKTLTVNGQLFPSKEMPPERAQNQVLIHVPLYILGFMVLKICVFFSILPDMDIAEI